MGSLARNGHLFLILLAAHTIATVACGGRDLTPVGVSLPRAPEPSAQDHMDGGPSDAPPLATDFRSHMTRLRERFLSRGHGERFDAILWGNDFSSRDSGADGANGAIFVEEAIVRDTRGDRSAGLLVMTKQGDSFRFDAVDPDGHVASRDRTAACMECHRETQGLVFPWLTDAQAP